MNKVLYFAVFVLVINRIRTHDIKGFDDTVLFDINWTGEPLKNEELIGTDSIVVTSSHQEKYRCVLPKVKERESNEEELYDGPTAIALISPLFSQVSCSYRLESYWTYEVCHGRFIRQYHEDREGKKVKLQEYILGKWSDGMKHFQDILSKAHDEEKDKSLPIPHKKIDNINLPYYEVTMGNGTFCDLNENKPRITKVLYVCYIHGKNEVYSLKETSTCQYEIIILTPLLCTHPRYKPKETGENKITCSPLENAPKKPHNLLKLKAESAKLRRNSDFDRFRVELVQFNDKEEIKIQSTKPTDTSPLVNFLSGKNCLSGGTGWWRYEFCYGKYVDQFHGEKDGSKTSIQLGYFDKKKHLAWIAAHPNKRPKPVGQRKQLSHFYSDGSVCDKTGKARQTEVKLKCLENSQSLSAVTLYLLEPKYCEYILGVESPLICDILDKADEDGLVDISSIELAGDEESTVESNIKL